MTLLRVHYLLRKHAWKVLLLVLVGVGCGYGFSRLLPKAYQSTTSIMLNPAQPSAAVPFVTSAMQNQSTTPGLATLASTYTEYLKSTTFAQKAIRQLHLQAPPADVSKAISTKLVSNTNVLRLTVRWSSPAESQRIADGVAALLLADNAVTPPNPVVTELQDEAQADKQQIAAVQLEIDAVQHDASLSAEQQSAALLPLRQEQLTLQDTYSRVLSALANNDIAPSAGSKVGQVLDPASPGARTPSPRLTTLFGGLAGLVLGLALTTLLEYLDATVDVPADLEAALRTPVLGTVHVIRSRRPLPFRSGQDGALENDRRLDPKLVAIREPAGQAALSFRLMRSMLALGQTGAGPKTLLVTSAVAGEGKSSVAANLAIAIAQYGKRVVLVDADLERPNVHRMFGLHNEAGLSDIVHWTAGLSVRRPEEILRAVPSVPNLWVVTSGPVPAEPTGWLSWEAAAEVVGLLSKLVDVVIFDAAPATLSADALMLAKHVDAVTVVARAASVRREAVAELAERLRQVQAPLLGGILNGVLGDQPSYYYRRQPAGRPEDSGIASPPTTAETA